MGVWGGGTKTSPQREGVPPVCAMDSGAPAVRSCSKSGLSGHSHLPTSLQEQRLVSTRWDPPPPPGPCGWFRPSRAPPTTLISLLPFLLFGVDVLFRRSLDLLDPGRPGGEAESSHRAAFPHQVPQEPQGSALANLGFDKFLVTALTLIQPKDSPAN